MNEGRLPEDHRILILLAWMRANILFLVVALSSFKLTSNLLSRMTLDIYKNSLFYPHFENSITGWCYISNAVNAKANDPGHFTQMETPTWTTNNKWSLLKQQKPAHTVASVTSLSDA